MTAIITVRDKLDVYLQDKTSQPSKSSAEFKAGWEPILS